MKRTIASCLLLSLTLLTGLLVAPAVCRADHWERIHDNPSQGLSYHVDTESIVIQGGMVRAWDRVVYTRPKSDSQGRLIFSQKYYKSYDCWERVQLCLQQGGCEVANRSVAQLSGSHLCLTSGSRPFNTCAERLELIPRERASRLLTWMIRNTIRLL
jgi:hypothetical protein